MNMGRSRTGAVAIAVLALAGVGVCGGAWAESHGGGGHGGHAAGSAPASHAAARGGGGRAAASGFQGQGAGHWGYGAPAHAWRGPPGRAFDHRVYTPGHGHGPWGRPRGWYGYSPPYFGFVAVLPWYFDTFWWNGIPYYYADNRYYLWNEGVSAYQVVPPPAYAGDTGDTGGAPLDLYVYPNSGQSPEQQSNDRYACHRFAADQTGFDPTQPGGGVAPEVALSRQGAYRRAEAACLAGRGYTAR
jgi:hypothetical protein